MITVITPTTGKDTLFNTISSIKSQTLNVPINHLLLWDDKREDEFLYPCENRLITRNPLDLECIENNYCCNSIVIRGSLVQDNAAGSALRAVGLMAANTDYVVFADDDVMWEVNHLETMIKKLEESKSDWGFCKRAIWVTEDTGFECLGIDEFESVGEDAKTPYKMVDNNCMIFKRKYGVSAACLYRNTEKYNDDRLMYSFLMKYAGVPCKTNLATVNQICPRKLIGFFKENCSKI